MALHTGQAHQLTGVKYLPRLMPMVCPLSPKDGGRDWSPLLITAMRGSNAWTRGSLVSMTRSYSDRYDDASVIGVRGATHPPTAPFTRFRLRNLNDSVVCKMSRTLTLYRDDSTVQVVYENVKAVFWTASNTVLVVSQYTDEKTGAHRYIHWPRERFCWFKDEP